MNNTLITSSVDIMKRYQSKSGAFIAAPDFSPYQYCWLRDGTFVAHALGVMGESQRFFAFHEFISAAICARQDRIHRVTEKMDRGEYVYDELLHTRYKTTGEEGTEPWGNFQLDGYGIWLWDACRIEVASPQVKQAAELTVQYLKYTWSLPCFDPWEEHPDKLNVATLGAVAAGLMQAAECRWIDDNTKESARATAIDVIGLIRDKGSSKKGMHKWVNADHVVDAALLWNIVPLGVIPVSDPIAIATIDEVESQLLGEGVKRYKDDSYYGGGDWIVTTAWLAWCYRRQGRLDEADELMKWIEGTAIDGQLPEQVPVNLHVEHTYGEWVDRWGPIACPLLWSHAMYVIARQAIT